MSSKKKISVNFDIFSSIETTEFLLYIEIEFKSSHFCWSQFEFLLFVFFYKPENLKFIIYSNLQGHSFGAVASVPS